jgi:catechol 2,3-dioxygenase-like lactoylglutathione lyase family enzyme
MISTALVAPTIGVKDLDRAKQFYGETLGLEQLMETDWSVVYKSGANSKLEVYATEYAGTNQATYATWEVGDIAAEVEVLEAAGVKFEEYDLPYAKRDGVIHAMGETGEKVAWFKDPDGNILCLHQ